MSFTHFRVFFAIITTAMALISIFLGLKSKKYIRSWTFFRSTHGIFVILVWNFVTMISRTQNEYKINSFMVMLFIAMYGLIGQQKYGSEEKNTNEIVIKKDKLINGYSLLTATLCLSTSVLFAPF